MLEEDPAVKRSSRVVRGVEGLVDLGIMFFSG
jgi:hypothetical protein